MKQKIYIGITENNELYYLEVETKSKDHPYFAISGSTLGILEEEDGERMAREMLEDGDAWRQMVEGRHTEMGLSDWVDHVLSVDGWANSFDIDYDIGLVEFEGKNYYFTYQSGGQHEERDFKKLFISQKSLDLLFDMWKKYHLKDKEVDLKMYLLDSELHQDEEVIAKEALKIILES